MLSERPMDWTHWLFQSSTELKIGVLHSRERYGTVRTTVPPAFFTEHVRVDDTTPRSDKAAHAPAAYWQALSAVGARYVASARGRGPLRQDVARSGLGRVRRVREAPRAAAQSSSLCSSPSVYCFIPAEGGASVAPSLRGCRAMRVCCIKCSRF